MRRDETYDYVTEHEIQQGLKRLGRRGRIRATATFILYVGTWAAMIYAFLSGTILAGAGLLVGVLAIHFVEISARVLFGKLDEDELLKSSVKLLRRQMKEAEREESK